MLFTQKPPIFAFTDCKDANALTRLEARLAVLFSGSTIHGVGIDTDSEAAGCILDTIDALRITGKKAVVIGNLAPRTDKHYKNGAPFYVGHVDYVTLIATKTCFALLAKLGLITTIYETDVETVCRAFLSEAEALRIANSQFRSFEYVPRLARWAYDQEKIPSTQTTLEPVSEQKVWWVDNFGNCKTTITAEELATYTIHNSITLSCNDKTLELPFYTRLADVPKGTLACIIGSSGYQDTRFAEIVMQGQSAAKELGITSGTPLVFK